MQAFRTVEKLKCHIKDCSKINGKQTIKMSKKGEYIQFKNFGRKIKSPFMIYVDFESILVPEDNGKQNPNESYTNKFQKHVACGYGYKLVCVDRVYSRTQGQVCVSKRKGTNIKKQALLNLASHFLNIF